jgi:hypothetical protein
MSKTFSNFFPPLKFGNWSCVLADFCIAVNFCSGEVAWTPFYISSKKENIFCFTLFVYVEKNMMLIYLILPDDY